MEVGGGMWREGGGRVAEVGSKENRKVKGP